MTTRAVRTQIYLPRKLHRALKRRARERGVSMAQVLREAAEAALERGARRQDDPFSDLIGTVRDGPTDLSEDHDRYLYGLDAGKP